MASMNLPPWLIERFFDHSTGAPLAGGKLYSYQAGTTTAQATYTDQSGVTPNANPIILDSNGECQMWLDPALSYKFVLKDSSDVVQWTRDNVVGLLSTGSVTTGSIAAGAVTTAKLAANSVTSTILSSDAAIDANRAVQTNHIRDTSVTGAKLNSNVVDNSSLQLSSNQLSVKAGGVTQAMLAARATGTTVAAGGVAVSTSSGTFSTTSSTYVDVTNLTVTITTTGRPVQLSLIDDGSLSQSSIRFPNAVAEIAILRGASQLTDMSGSNTGTAINVPVGLVSHVDIVAAGTYTYKIQLRVAGGLLATIQNAKLVAYEI